MTKSEYSEFFNRTIFKDDVSMADGKVIQSEYNKILVKDITYKSEQIIRILKDSKNIDQGGKIL